MELRKISFLLVGILCLCSISVQAGRRWRRLRCSRPRLQNGNVRIKSRGRVARYRCQRGYELYGLRFNTCVGRRWLDPQPICISAGCEEPDVIAHGFRDFIRPQKLVHYSCEPGFQLEGHPVMYCNGRHWNGTEPSCQSTTSGGSPAALKCIFDTEDLCGWTHDQSAEFHWTQHTGRTPSVDMYTGPSHDHTDGAGQYMYIEASDPRVENDTARLFSPVYPREQSIAACFSLWYHHWGGSVGAIRVYILPVSTSLDDLDGPAWEVTDSQGDRWKNVVIDVPMSLYDFQIVIEGVRGDSYMSDSAIDDVTLMHGADCIRETTTATAPTATPPGLGDSCRGRCDAPASPDTCGCSHECLLDNNCCTDYSTACLEEDTSADGTVSTTADSAVNEDKYTTTQDNVSYSSTTSQAPTAFSTATPTEGSASTSSTPQPSVAASTSPPMTPWTENDVRTATTLPDVLTTQLVSTTETTTAQRSTPDTTSTQRPTTRHTTTQASTTRQTTRQASTTQRRTTITSTTSSTRRTTTEQTTTRWTTERPNLPPSSPRTTPPPPRTTTERIFTTITTPTRRSSTTQRIESTTSMQATKSQQETTTDMSNELPGPVLEEANNALPQASRSKSAASSSSASASFPLYAIVGIGVGVFLLVATVGAVLAHRYCRGGGGRHRRPLGGDNDDDSLVFFSEPDNGAEPTLDLRLRSRAESVPSRPAPKKPAKERKDSADLEEFAVEAFEDQSETARLTS